MDARLEEIYLKELENTVTTKFKENDFEVVKCKIDAVLDTTKKNAGIHSIEVKIKGEVDNNKFTDLKKEISKELEIDENKIIIK